MKIQQKIKVLLIVCSLGVKSIAQVGGAHTFALLNLPYSARSAALGTDFISVKDQDVNLGVSNPSLYNSKMNHFASVNQALLAGGINYGMFSFAQNVDSIYNVAASIRYINYGQMVQRDEAGNEIGKFTPGEFIIGVGGSKQLDKRISIGTNLNLLYSQLASYSSLGFSVDVAGSYYNEEKRLLVTALVKNVGIQVLHYTSKNKEFLPIEMQMALSYKVAHAPFRFSLLAHHLNQWDLTYFDSSAPSTINPLTGEVKTVKPAGFLEKFGRHFNYQCELLMTDNFHLRVAYDYHRRQEMKLLQRPGLSGFSFGVGMTFKRIKVDYGLAIFSSSGFNNMLTLRANIDDFKR